MVKSLGLTDTIDSMINHDLAEVLQALLVSGHATLMLQPDSQPAQVPVSLKLFDQASQHAPACASAALLIILASHD